jgi:hypothetical protein
LICPKSESREELQVMPIKIFSCEDGAPEIAWLCDDDWRLSEQADALEQWLRENRFKLKPGDYIADIGFSPRQQDAWGGGAAISPESMRTMAELGMTLFVSEYPPANSGSC